MLAAAAAGCSRVTPGDGSQAFVILKVRVAAAADLKYALDDVVDEFHKLRGSSQVEVTYGSSGSFYSQLTNRAPFDLFLSADAEYPRRLAEAGLTGTHRPFVYAYGRLVVCVRPGAPLDVEKRGLQILLDPSVRKVALANPRHAPYGRAAEAALRHRGLYEKVQAKLVYGENVAQAAQFIDAGAADAGFVAQSLLTPSMRYAEVPRSDYPRIEQSGTILGWARDPQAAGLFQGFLQSHQGKAVLRRHGLDVPPE